MLLASLTRLVARSALAFFALTATAAFLHAQTPSAADGFDPSFDGNVYTLATQPDGKIIVGGQFANFRTHDGFLVARNNIARLNADGTLDTTFDPNANGPVRALIVQADGRIIIGGDFSTLQPAGTATPVSRSCLARLNANGTIDSLALNIGGAPLAGGSTLRPQVFALTLQPDGALVIGGSFGTVQPGLLTVTFTRHNLFRVTSAGAVDASFDPNPNGMVLALAPHLNGKLIVGGGFSSFQEAGKTSATTRNRVARLNPDGTLDTQFDPNANNGVTSIAIQRDGKIVLAGFFTTLQPLGNDSPANRNHIGRLNVDGTLDSEFYPNANASVTTVAVQPDGSIVLGGAFNAVWGLGSVTTPRNGVARFNPDGSLDVGFNPGVNAEVAAFAFQPDGRLVLGGYFTRLLPAGVITPLVRNHIARLNPDGSVDTAFTLDAGGRVLTSVTQSDGKVVIGGSFTAIGSGTHDYLARLNADGSVDTAYNPDLNGRVLALAYDAGANKVLVGGAFTAIGGETRNHIARMNPNGTIDSEFNPNIDGQVAVILLQSDGKILVGGSFTSVQPIGATTTTARSNLLRLNANGTLDTAFDPAPNAGVAALALQGDGKVIIGGAFTALTPGVATTTTATPVARNYLARVNSADGTLDTTFAPHLNDRVNAIALQGDGKIVVGGAFSQIVPTGANATTTPTTRAHLARFNADGSIDTTYDPNPNGVVLALALQSDGKLIIGGKFTTLQPLQPTAATDWTLRKYAARLNADGTIDPTFNLDLNEQGGNSVDSLRVQSDGRVIVGGQFTSLQPIGTAARTPRAGFARINTNATLDLTFNPGVGGSTGGLVNALAVQADSKVIAVGSFADLGAAKTVNIARFNPEGTPDTTFNSTLSADGPINSVIVRPTAAPTATQTSGFAWLARNGALRTAFAPSANARLSGTVSTAVIDSGGRLLLGGTFANLGNATAGNLVRFLPGGTLDIAFNPAPNGNVTSIALQPDRKIIIAGAFTLVNGVPRNNIARLNDDGSLDNGFDPNANSRINALVLQSDGKILIGGAFISLTPNASGTALTRNYIARLNPDGTLDDFNPTANSVVNAIALQADGKPIIGGSFTTLQPNGGATAFARDYIARLNTDGSLDQNFDPNANSSVNALVVQPNGQILVGGTFTVLQPTLNGAASTAITRNNLARINSDGAVDPNFIPNFNAAVTALALQPDGTIVVGGTFTTVQANGASAAVTRNRIARLNSDGSLDLTFNPDVNGGVSFVGGQPDSSVLLGGNFTGLQTNGSIVVGGSFSSIGGVSARNLAMLNDDGSVNAIFLPAPNAAVNAVLAQPDGKIVVGGAFTNIAGVARDRLARFNADGTLDTTFNAAADATVNSLALQPDGKIVLGGAFTTVGGQPRLALARLNADGSVDAGFSATGLNAVNAVGIQSDGRILAIALGVVAPPVLQRFNADGTTDATFRFTMASNAGTGAFAVQTDGRIIASGTTAGALVRINANGAIDTTFAPAPNGAVTALALQADGRLMVGGNFSSIGGESRFGIARLALGAATQTLTASSDRRTVTWTRAGVSGELAAVVFEQSANRVNWVPLATATRVAGSSTWQATGLSLPATGTFYIRARGIAPGTAGKSSGVYETVREFNFASPLGGPAVDIAIATAPTSSSAAAAGVTMLPGAYALSYDAFSGIAFPSVGPVRAAISIVPGEGTVEIFAALAPLSGTSNARLANLSTRGTVSATSPLILGFAISGSESRPVLIRAVGPALRGFGVSDAVASTRLQLYDANSRLVLTAEGGVGATDVAQAAARTGAFPLTAGSADSAALVTLAPGNYTMQVVAPSNGSALAEIYDAGAGSGARLVNVSSRGSAGAGNATLISGFVISGDAPKRVLLRGVGPALAQFGASSVIADPMVTLYDGSGRELGGNDNWVSSISQVSTAAASVGAFALQAGSKDAAVIATLSPGAYTVQITPVADTASGTALLEIYELP